LKYLFFSRKTNKMEVVNFIIQNVVVVVVVVCFNQKKFTYSR